MLAAPHHGKILCLHHEPHGAATQQYRQLSIVPLHCIGQQAQHAPLLVLLVGLGDLRWGREEHVCVRHLV